MNFNIRDEETNTLYNKNYPWPNISSLRSNGIVSYDSITDEITVNVAEALRYSGSYYGYLDDIPEDKWDTIMRFNIGPVVGCSFATMDQEERMNTYRAYDDLNVPAYAVIPNPNKGFGIDIPKVKGSFRTMRKRKR